MRDFIAPKPLLYFGPNSRHRARHPLYSLDLAPSDFWLFAYQKGVLQGSPFDAIDEPDELLSAIHGFPSEVDRVTLDAIFQEWMIRLQNALMKW
jgi:hypothetical protein